MTLRLIFPLLPLSTSSSDSNDKRLTTSEFHGIYLAVGATPIDHSLILYADNRVIQTFCHYHIHSSNNIVCKALFAGRFFLH